MPKLNSIMDKLTSIVGEDNIITGAEALQEYSHDPSPFPILVPGMVVRPGKTGEVSQIVELCNSEKVPIMPFGSGYSFTGLSNRRGELTLVLDLKRMNRIIDIDQDNLSVRAQCGTIVGELSDKVRERGFYVNTVSVPYYKDTLGGMLSGVIGGGYSLYSGSEALNNRHILSLQVVLPNGRLIETNGKGTNLHATTEHMRETNSPDVTGLFIGDGGSFGVKTEATLALYPLPTHWASMSRLFPNFEKLWEALVKLMSNNPLLYDAVTSYSPTITSVYTSESHETRWSLAYYSHGFSENEVARKKLRAEEILRSSEGSIGAGALEEFASGLRTGESFWGKAAQFADLLVRRASIPFFAGKNRFRDTFLRLQGYVEEKVGNERKEGLELNTGYIIRPIQRSTVWANANIYYYADDVKPRVCRILKDGYKFALKEGVSFEPHGGYAADVMGTGWSANFRELFISIKNSIDPNRILNPGLWSLDT